MLGIFVKTPWPDFYKKGMKTWEIRSYPIDYRGDVLLIESGTNKAICKMSLIDCIPLESVRNLVSLEVHASLDKSSICRNLLSILGIFCCRIFLLLLV